MHVSFGLLSSTITPGGDLTRPRPPDESIGALFPVEACLTRAEIIEAAAALASLPEEQQPAAKESLRDLWERCKARRPPGATPRDEIIPGLEG
jgi:hypothetical protein